MKQKDFIFNIFFLLFLNLLIKPFWILGIDRGVQNAVGAESYGLYFAVLNFTIIFNMLLDFGLTNFNNRNIAQNTQLLSKHVSSILSLKVLLGVLYFVIVLFAGIIVGYSNFQLKILIWLALNQFLNALILYLRSNVAALLMFKTDGVLSVLDRLITILICSVLLWSNIADKSFQIMWFVYAQTAAYLIAAAVALSIVLYNAKFIRLTWNFTFFRAILKKSFPFAMLALLMSIYGRIDSVLIERILPSPDAAYQAGIFASAFRLLDALVNVSLLFAVILLPLFSKMLKKKEDLVPIIKSAFTLLFFFAVTSTVLLVAYRVPVITSLYHPEISGEAVRVFVILIFCLIPWSMTYIFGTLLTANGSMRLLNITSAIAIVINIAINFTLIPILEARGAAIASLATQSSIMIMQFIIAFRLLKIPFSTLPYFRCLLYVCLLIASTCFAIQYLHFGLILNLLICGCVALVWAFVTRLIPLGFIREVFPKA
ncbi:MAG: oligosaccharide flippase family protein [Bacteroidetes bacterium]|nr:oligosaccharide flippase family protein [Bacteroidota bacterium]MCL2303137.1 oligosaccharide flippase family protein [Lentimicrobiaceae bacterium]